MPSVTGQEIVNDALALLNVYAPGEAVPDNQAELARRFLNDMLSEWGQRDLFIPVISRERFSMLSNEGGPESPYTIGPGGDLDTERPSNQGSIQSVNLILTNSDPEVRIWLGAYTDVAYAANQLPSMTNSQPTSYYYNPYYTHDLGLFYLWPVPNTAQNDLELFLQKAITQFDDLATPYAVPDGIPRALKYNLADLLQAPFGRDLSSAALRIAVSSLATFKRSNTKLGDLMNDFTMGTSRTTQYNIQTGN